MQTIIGVLLFLMSFAIYMYYIKVSTNMSGLENEQLALFNTDTRMKNISKPSEQVLINSLKYLHDILD